MLMLNLDTHILEQSPGKRGEDFRKGLFGQLSHFCVGSVLNGVRGQHPERMHSQGLTLSVGGPRKPV